MGNKLALTGLARKAIFCVQSALKILMYFSGHAGFSHTYRLASHLFAQVQTKRLIDLLRKEESAANVSACSAVYFEYMRILNERLTILSLFAEGLIY